ncbi:IS481 family transposase, partial [Enterobacter sichuanensis]
HCNDERRETVQQQLVSVFERYGLPDRMTMDNGSPWGDTTGTWTALDGQESGYQRKAERERGKSERG